MNNKPLLDVIHDTAKGLYECELINTVTMREYDDLCLPEVSPLTAQEIKKIRLGSKVSQSVFAKYLNTSKSTVQKWETGEKTPQGSSLKLLNLVRDKGLSILV